jgi:hypothetical protein
MAEYTRLSVTANLGFVSTAPEQLEKTAKKFQSKLTKLLTANDSILPEEISVSLSKMEGQNFTFKNDSTETSVSYHLSIMGHIRNFDSKPLAEKVYIKLADLVKEYRAEVVIFSLLTDEKYSSNHVLKKGQYIHF